MKSWFEDIKWVEMVSAIGFQCAALFIAQVQGMHVDPKTAAMAVGTAFPGMIWNFLRNPKPFDWAKTATDLSPDAAKKLGIRTDRGDEI